jgi:hypothetical protein
MIGAQYMVVLNQSIFSQMAILLSVDIGKKPMALWVIHSLPLSKNLKQIGLLSNTPVVLNLYIQTTFTPKLKAHLVGVQSRMKISNWTSPITTGGIRNIKEVLNQLKSILQTISMPL